MSKKCTPLWREAHFEVRMLKTQHVRATFGRWSVVLWGRRKGFCTLRKVSKTWGFCSTSKRMAGVGHLKSICKDGFRVAGAVQETCSSEMLRGVAFWSIRSSGLPRWFCGTGAALRMTWHHFFLAGAVHRSTLNRWNGKIATRIGTRPSALPSTFHFWRMSRTIASFLMLSMWKTDDVSQNCFLFDIVKFKNWGSLAE